MKATYKRYLAAAFATVGFFNLGVSQVTPDAMGPDHSKTTDLGVTATGAPALDTASAPQIIVNHTQVSFNGAMPGLINGQLLVPIRDVAEQCGATVSWHDQDKEAVIVLPDHQSVTLSANRDWLNLINDIGVSGTAQEAQGGPEPHFMLHGDEIILIGNRAYMAFDELASAIDGTGNWDQSASSATITTVDISTGEDKVPNTATPTPDSTPPPGDSTPPSDNSTPPPSPDTNPY